MTEKHLALRDNIGTYEEEDKAFNLLTWLSWHLPVFVVASALLDLLLAVVYLKWLHPWKIILQEVNSSLLISLAPLQFNIQRTGKYSTSSSSMLVLTHKGT